MELCKQANIHKFNLIYLQAQININQIIFLKVHLKIIILVFYIMLEIDQIQKKGHKKLVF